jgi:protein-S-isoprenylcysteine O-methyltransferase Ste14
MNSFRRSMLKFMRADFKREQIYLCLQSKINERFLMNIIGKTTLNPFFFYTGKISGYVTWTVFPLSFLDIFNFADHTVDSLNFIPYALIAFGLIVTTAGLIYLGGSTRVGLPTEETTLKTSGIYRISRNPIYLGLNCFTLAAMVFTWNAVVILLGLYSVVIHHFIVLGEEKFLESRFGKAYIEYKNRTRRYV